MVYLKQIQLLTLTAGLVVMTLSGCNSGKNSTADVPTLTESSGKQSNVTTIETNPAFGRYRETPTRYFDLIHMDLSIKPDWDKSEADGQALLILKPWFAPMDELILDAKGMQIGEVRILTAADTSRNIKISYDQYKMRIPLDRKYTSRDTLKVRIRYRSRPNQLHLNCPAHDPGSKGLFFIKPGKYSPQKPRQLWTQGEPEDASVWFPTIENTGERFTHRIAITVPDEMVTLSNGMLTSSRKDENGLRTDIWEMNMPHAAYLVMLAAGEFAVIQDQWEGIPVHYYVEKAYAEHARKIFPHTVEMLGFFSERLGVKYPWPKYHQIVVRDYTSGAMENTSAVVFGEFIQKVPSELENQFYESIVAHEMMHHWFGDLVTCESWVHLALNESFANYSEYLWVEYKYGKEAAEAYRFKEAEGYFDEASREGDFKREALIRYDYFSKEDMFDAHSYNKGGLILHALRQEIGDSAFFLCLKHYLTQNAYKSTEVHHLRLAFEEITGRDLTIFFNQWFLSKGHPEIRVSMQSLPESGTTMVILKQTQPAELVPVYRLDVPLTLYGDFEKVTINWQTRHRVDTFFVQTNWEPRLIVADPERILPVEWNHGWNVDDMYRLMNMNPQPGIFLQLEILKKLNDFPRNQRTIEIARKYLNSSNEQIRIAALELLGSAQKGNALTEVLKQSLKDPKPLVVETAIKLADKLPESDARELLNGELLNRSAGIKAAVIRTLAGFGRESAMAMIEKYKTDTLPSVVSEMAGLYAKYPLPEAEEWFLKMYDYQGDNSHEVMFIIHFGRWMQAMGPETIERNLGFFEEILREDPMYYARYGAYIALSELLDMPAVQKNKFLQQKISIILTTYLRRERNLDMLRFLGIEPEPEP